MGPNEVTKVDPKFYERADAHIHLSNSQLDEINPGKVSSSMMYATARFNAYVSWIGFDQAADMAGVRNETIRYFVEQYQIMLEENLDDYITNFARYADAGWRFGGMTQPPLRRLSRSEPSHVVYGVVRFEKCLVGRFNVLVSGGLSHLM